MIHTLMVKNENMFVNEDRNASKQYMITEPLLRTGQRDEYLQFLLASWPAVL